jgi:sugar lactone lactonase YvrE
MARAQELATGIYFGEGPRWHDGALWFSDFYANAVKTCTEDGKVDVTVSMDTQPSGLGWLPNGDLLIVSMQDRKLMRRDSSGALSVHADLSGIATFHCNDMVVSSSGVAYVGNFGFDLDHELEARGIEAVLGEHPTAALARVDPDGSASVAATDMDFPNGSVITPDGRTLIVAESLGMRLTAFDIGDDGSLSNRRVWAPLGNRVPDGICLDAEGMVWVANPLAPEAFLVAEGGDVVDVVETSQPCYACMLGGADGQTLFCLTATSSMAAVSSASPLGKIETARVDVARAGLP